MLVADFQLQGFEPADWRRLLRLLFPFGADSPAGASHGIVAVARRDELLQLWRAHEGGLPVSGIDWPLELRTLAEKYRAPWAVSLHPTALSELSERFASRVTPKDSPQDQWVRLMVALTELVNEDAIKVWPRTLFNWPSLLAENVARSALELLCPPGKCLVLGFFDSGTLDVALAIQRGERDIEHVVGPQLLKPSMGLLSGDWLRDYPHLIRAVETDYASVAGGCFTQSATLARLLAADTPGAWSQAVAARDVVLHPISPALAVSLGIDVGRAALAGVQALTRRMSLSSLAQHPGFQRVKTVARLDGGFDDLFKLDPLSAIGRMLLDRRED